MAGRKREAIDLETLSRGKGMLLLWVKVLSRMCSVSSMYFGRTQFNVISREEVTFFHMGCLCAYLGHPMCVYSQALCSCLCIPSCVYP